MDQQTRIASRYPPVARPEFAPFSRPFGSTDGAAAPPRPLDVEIPRSRLLGRLDERWDRAVTLLIAGPGFGKTTILAQALRAHLLEPRGIDIWISCGSEHEDAGLLATTMLRAITADEPDSHRSKRTTPTARDVVDALISLAPLEVCLVVDDVHAIAPASPGAELLQAVVTALPATAHVVLAGHVEPELTLARREAAGQVCRIGCDELAFTDEEVGALARRLGGDPVQATGLHGWPALVRLAFAAGPAAPARYAREEILHRLPEPQLRALAALAALGSATPAEVAAVTAGPVALDDLARRVPLVNVLADGRYRAHDLWTEAAQRMQTAPELQLTRNRAIDILAERGDLARAGSLTIQAQDWPRLANLAITLVHTTLSALPRLLAGRWLGAATAAAIQHEPGFVLLRAAAAHAEDFTDDRIDTLLDQAWRDLRDRGDRRGAAAVIGQAVITAHSRADVERLAEIAGWAASLDTARDRKPAGADAQVEAIAAVLRHTVAGVLAELAGDPERALAHFEQAPINRVPRPVALSTWRFHFHCLNMCGRGQEAADLADGTLAEAGDERVRLSGAMARWFDGDPRDLAAFRAIAPSALAAAGPMTPATGTRGTAREAFVVMALAAVMAASCGETAGLPRQPCGNPASHDNSRDAVLACVAEAGIAVAKGDEPAAERAYAELLRTWPIDDRFTERHLRRFVALGYVLQPRLRRQWDASTLGPSHASARMAARALLAARAGDVSPASELAPEHALCFLPLRWSVELAARLTAAGLSHGVRLAGWLGDTLGSAVHVEIRVATRSACGPLSAGATQLLAALPAPAQQRISISMFGPMALSRDGVRVDVPELRRARVRQLLGALAVRPSITRNQAIELLWPDIEPVKAARNMRVTLTHLRRLLEPDRAGGDASFHLRTDGDTLRLVRSEALTVDLWTLEHLDRSARDARARGDIDRAATFLGEAIGLWRGEPLPDLGDLGDPMGLAAIDRLRATHVAQLLELGELRLVADDAAGALNLGDRALALEPFDARGHRLVLAAAIRGRHPMKIAATRRRVCGALRELGANPDPATVILLRRAAALTGAPGRQGPPNQRTAGTNNTRAINEMQNQARHPHSATVTGTASSTITATSRLPNPKTPHAVPCNRASASSASSE